MSDTSVVFSVLARDRASRALRNIANNARTSSAAIVGAFGPALAPVLASATAGVVGLGAALGGAGAALGVFGAVTKTAFTEMQEASQKSEDLREKIALLTEQAKVAEETGLADAGKIEKARDKAITELMARYNQMPPALRRVTMAYDGMRDAWAGFVDKNKPQVYAIMTSGFSSLTAIIPKLQPLFDAGAAAAQRFVGWLSRAANGGGIDRLVAFLTSQAGPALDNLATIGKNLGITLGAAFRSTAPAGQGMLAWLGDLSEKAANFATGGGFNRFMGYVNEHGPTVVATLRDLATAAVNIYKGISPLAPVTVAVAGALAKIVSVIPPEVITTLVGIALGLKGISVAMVAVNLAMAVSPIGWLVIGIGALVAVIVLIATKTDWFQRLWAWAWGGIKAAASAVGRWFRDVLWKQWILGAWNGITSAGSKALDWFRDLPGRLKSALAKVAGFITAPFRSAFNSVASFWNNSVGNLSFSVPGWIPGIGGNSFSLPKIPMLAAGGNVIRAGAAVVGERGPELVSLNRGAQVTPLTGGRGGGGGGVITLRLDFGSSELGRAMAKAVRTQPAVRSEMAKLLQIQVV